jgi:RHH-type proline utilization regulon transcriptional repressor/proline dehydrogenase/delta 1-pyrroline-5-carboxylate dehydrogenase
MSGASRRWLFDEAHPAPFEVDGAISAHYLADEDEAVRSLLAYATLDPAATLRIGTQARALVAAIRRGQRRAGGVDALLSEYDLSSAEGIALMCLAEALLRIPDAGTADRLIADKLARADWQAHLGASESLFVNASTWALLLTGRIVAASDVAEQPATFVARLVERVGEPVVRAALRQAMRILGQQFVTVETIDAALRRAARAPEFDYSFDMLGEAALTAADAERYFESYRAAISAIGAAAVPAAPGRADTQAALSISVKLSALSPRYEPAQAARALPELAGRLRELATAARDAGIGLTVDAEEAERLELSLAIFARVMTDSRFAEWPGLGVAVQAYQKRAPHVLRWLDGLARDSGRMVPVRLVKGAYWDSEIKRAQELGLAGYPVFTRKNNTDTSYLACAKALLLEHTHLYPQFATHNAHTVAWLIEVGAERRFEFQRLHGMGEELYAELLARPGFERHCRVYAPVGSHEHLLPYLVRRLLENGANTSFVNRLIDADSPIAAIVADPLEKTRVQGAAAHPAIPPPARLFEPERLNSRGRNLAAPREHAALGAELAAVEPCPWRARPSIAGEKRAGERHEWRDPAAQTRIVGVVEYASADTAAQALERAARAQPAWNAVTAERRAEFLLRAAELVEARSGQLVVRCVAEAGRTVPDSLNEIREAVDLLRYYAAQCVQHFARPRLLPGPTGERNELKLVGRGVFVCISPWNFPVSIFMGQIAAALAAGNAVIAKPAEQASLTGAYAFELLLEAGIPPEVLHFLPGDGRGLGEALLPDPRVAGVVFTGSVETARAINGVLARRDGPLATLIAETGGINAMIADSSALAEQVVRDAVQSAFNSAGQRCSALRLLCVQHDTADEVLRLMRGCLDELVIGDPALLATDVGPVIDREAYVALTSYLDAHRESVVHQCRLDARHARGLFIAPTVLEIATVGHLRREVFGPVLHVVRYHGADAGRLIDEINANGYGLTLGIHTRIDEFARSVAARARVGNVYVNRNMIGAQVGAQPFGGMGLSGTGPKAGGPSYVRRFAVEQTVTTNPAAVGGNATLLSLAAEGPGA